MLKSEILQTPFLLKRHFHEIVDPRYFTILT